MKIIIGFSKPSKFKIGAALIRWYEKSPYSHVYLKIYSGWADSYVIYQASHGKVHATSAAHFFLDNIAVAEFEYELSTERFKKLFKYCLANLQKPYGFLGLIKIAIKKAIRTRGDGEQSFHCSEFALRAMPELATIDPDFVTPSDLFKNLSNQSNIVRIL